MAVTNFQAFMDDQLRMMGAMPTLAGSKPSETSSFSSPFQSSNQTSTQISLPMTERVGDRETFNTFADFLNQGVAYKNRELTEKGRQFDAENDIEQAGLDLAREGQRNSDYLALLQANRDWLSSVSGRAMDQGRWEEEMQMARTENDRAYNLERSGLLAQRFADHANRAAARTNDMRDRQRQSRMDFQLAQENRQARNDQMNMFNRGLLETERDRELQRYLAGVELEKSRYNANAARDNAALDFAGSLFGSFISGSNNNYLNAAYRG